MSDPVPEPPAPRPLAMLLAAGGLAAAFGAAACCALPLMLASAGLGAAWLGGVGLIAGPHRGLLIALAASLLLAGAVALWRQHRAARACAVGRPCATPTYQIVTLAGLLVGAGLLGLGYVYG